MAGSRPNGRLAPGGFLYNTPILILPFQGATLPDSVQVQRVSRSDDEFALLTSIVDHLADDAPRSIYADWLEEHDDTRGTLLREFVEAERGDADLPSLEGLDPAWIDITGLTILKAIRESGLGEARDQLLALARPALRLEMPEADFDHPPPAPAGLGTTRLGGDPDLPGGAAFPTGGDGVPLHFLGQFNLADLQGTMAGRWFPESGLMSVFRPQSDGKNCYPTAADCPLLVRVFPQDVLLVRLRRPSDQTDPPAPFRPGLQVVETLRLPFSIFKWPRSGLTFEQTSELEDQLPHHARGTDFLLLGHVIHDNIGEEPLAERPDWVQLLLVPYAEGPDYGISDMSLSYQLPAADLKRGRFSALEATFG